MEFSREHVIAYRVAAQQLHRDARAVPDLAVLDIGVQEAMGQPVALAFAARLPAEVPLAPAELPIGPEQQLAMTWTLRGAPHVHRRADLDAIAAALWPLSEADAAGRLNETGPSVKKAGIAALEQFQLAVDAMRKVVTSPTGKGAASTAVTKRIPRPMRRDCRACKTQHISDSAMRAAAPAAGLEMEPGTAPPVLLPRPGAELPSGPDLAALGALALGYLSLLGPADIGEVAGYLDARRADLASGWPADLVEVSVAGRRAWLPESRIDQLRAAPEPDIVRLLGAFDPYLQARDRDLIVPDKALHKILWPVLGRPGALFVDGEVAGVWRTKTSGKNLTINVEAFAPLRPKVWKQVDAEAERVAEARGIPNVAVHRVD
ncbi:MAG TPA: crosslink repair DNA glycosylase YcaQ family protein [Jatrophihabitans sp.]|nr:crosslink repair DNA glycosylase YcaQ family protein [Jatrophihabitans sp.]